MLSMIPISTAPLKAAAEARSHLVIASFRNGSMPEAERAKVLEAAQQAGVTTWEFLRGRLLIQANITMAGLDDEEQ
jgi:hypothetical protein